MSFLLTEIALEMLGYQFYDDDGEPRNTLLEGSKIPRTEGALTLEESLGIKFGESKLTETEKAVSKPIEEKINTSIDLEKVVLFNITKTMNENVSNESVSNAANYSKENRNYCMKKETTTNDSELNFKAKNSVDANNVDVSYAIVGEKTRKKILPPSSASAHTESELEESHESIMQFKTIKKLLECEMVSIDLDLKREKSIFYKNLGWHVKSNLNNILQALATYRKQEQENLQSELKTLLSLRQKVEHLTSNEVP